MQLKSLKLHNAFQHESLEIPFAPFQAIVGQNGSGKSNIIESIGFLLTGKFTLPGTNESMIKEGETEGAISAVIEHEGEEILLSTKLGKSSRSLKRKDLKLGKAAEVMDYMANVVLRTPFDVVNSSTIIRQGELTGGLFESQAKRTDAFMRMAGLADIEKKRQILADARAAVSMPMLSFSVSEAEKKVQELHDYIAKTEQERSEIQTFEEQAITDARTLIANTDQAEKLKSTLVQLNKELAEANEMQGSAKTLLAAQQQELANLQQRDAELRVLAVSAAADVKNYAKAKKDWENKQQFEAQLDALGKQVASLKEVPAEYTGPDAAEFSAIVAELTVRIQALKRTIGEFSKEVSVCPVCRRSCTPEESKQIRETADAEFKELSALLSESTRELSNANMERVTWETSLNEYRNKLHSLLTNVQVVESRLEAVKDAVEPHSVSDQQKVSDEYSRLVQKIKAKQAEVRNTESILSDATAVVSDVQVKLAKAGSTATAGVTKSSPEYCEAKQLIDEYETVTKRLVELNTVLTETRKRLTDEQARLEKLRADVEKSKALVVFTDHLEFARTALHRDNFPSGKVKAFVDRMLVNANVYLDTMDSGFSVSYSNETGFSAFFHGSSKSMRADRLSGGEKVIFALAFRFAVNEMHTDTGFLVLDEPTVWLDDKHIDYVINALALVKSTIVPRVQLIIVTHDERLAAVADSVFEVKKG